ncbi:hypothetical protein [Actinoplanes sp. NPDC051851]|uniref:hypothetical protein n=1 Tax=Actinoplanes sp. NPDC051851 TaxID=3154753 RepID=UPI0034288251
MQLLTRGLAGLIVLGILLTSGFLIVGDEPPAEPTDRAIASRSVDPRPLTAAEAFPTGAAGYRVDRTEVEADCRVTVTGALRKAISGYGCSQAVRASLTVPEGGYRVTAGILNLADTESATAVGERVRRLVETSEGGFTAITGDQPTPGTPVGWRSRGHYLLYCVITTPPDAPVTSAGPEAITANLLDGYLSGTVLARRAR